ncbi:MAG: HD domain-containing protein [Candidatus Eremiobacteraeota bacterium]|nr:HD domain-containing protein [Candidatus Eremiobacteraeota bacterium]
MKNLSPETIIETVLKNNPKANVELIRKAFDFASEIHEGQHRSVEDKPYFIHPYRSALYLANEVRVGDAENIVIALLHDTYEDGPEGTGERILEQFGKFIYDSVLALSKTKEPSIDKTKMRREYYRKIKSLPRSLIQIKLSDRLDNLRAVHKNKKRRLIKETMEHLYPLAEKYFPKIAKDILTIMEDEHDEHSDIF